MKLRLALVAALAASSAAALAADRFQELDRNADGFLSREEATGYEGVFTEADDNGDRRLNSDEFFKAESMLERQQAGKYVGDSVITGKVKAALLREQGIRSSGVHVETREGRVLLSGFVDNEAQKKRVVSVAAGVEGVKEVRDGLTVR